MSSPNPAVYQQLSIDVISLANALEQACANERCDEATALMITMDARLTKMRESMAVDLTASPVEEKQSADPPAPPPAVPESLDAGTH